MDDLDRRLLAGWERVRGRLLGNPQGGGEAVGRFKKFVGSQLAKPLRAWSLVLRAGDTRIDELAGEGKFRKGSGQLWLDAAAVRGLCGPVSIAWPGVGPAEAAGRFGVSEVTLWRWSKKMGAVAAKSKDAVAGGGPLGAPSLRRVRGGGARGGCGGGWGGGLVRDLYVNRADRKRDEVRYWTQRPIDPAGEVFTGPWGTVRQELTRLVPDDFEQEVRRVGKALGKSGGKRKVGRGSRVSPDVWVQGARDKKTWQWVCPGCGAWVYRLYWAMGVWTIAAVFSEEAAAWARRPVGEGFACRKCAGLVYESSEAHWKAGAAGEAVFWDRFVRRISSGMLGADDVRE